jgi:hypothetical protein
MGPVCLGKSLAATASCRRIDDAGGYARRRRSSRHLVPATAASGSTGAIMPLQLPGPAAVLPRNRHRLVTRFKRWVMAAGYDGGYDLRA